MMGTRLTFASHPWPKGFHIHEAMAFWTGLYERPSSLRLGGVGKLPEIFFGFRQKRPLANKRLECIRRVTVCLNHRLSRELPSEIGAARREGVTHEQIEALVCSLEARSLCE